jgi:hypothetical protein
VGNVYQVVETFWESPNKSGDPSGLFSTMSPNVFTGCMKRKNPQEKNFQPTGSKEDILPTWSLLK